MPLFSLEPLDDAHYLHRLMRMFYGIDEVSDENTKGFNFNLFF